MGGASSGQAPVSVETHRLPTLAAAWAGSQLGFVGSQPLLPVWSAPSRPLLVTFLSPHPQAEPLASSTSLSDAFNLGLSCPIPKLQLLSKQASQAPAPPSQAFLVSSPDVGSGQASCSVPPTASHIPADNRPTRLFHPLIPLSHPTHGEPRTGCAWGGCTFFHSTPKPRQQSPIQVRVWALSVGF